VRNRVQTPAAKLTTPFAEATAKNLHWKGAFRRHRTARSRPDPHPSRPVAGNCGNGVKKRSERSERGPVEARGDHSRRREVSTELGFSVTRWAFR